VTTLPPCPRYPLPEKTTLSSHNAGHEYFFPPSPCPRCFLSKFLSFINSFFLFCATSDPSLLGILNFFLSNQTMRPPSNYFALFTFFPNHRITPYCIPDCPPPIRFFSLVDPFIQVSLTALLVRRVDYTPWRDEEHLGVPCV